MKETTLSSFLPELSVVVPVYNEEPNNLERLLQRLQDVLVPLGITYELVFVDDGSREPTAKVLREISMKTAHVQTVVLSRNYGEQAAICAGLAHSRGRVVVNMDSDLQDPPELIPNMLDYWRQGYEVVYTQQIDRSDSAFRLYLTNVYYWLLHKFSRVAVSHAGEFRLLSRRAVSTLLALPEKTVFLRFLVPFIGFKQVTMPFKRDQRTAGVSAYTTLSLIKVGVSGLISATSAPLVVIPLGGLMLTFIAGLSYLLFCWLRPQLEIRQFESFLVWCFCLMNMGIMSVLAFYLAATLNETRARPLYIVAEVLSCNATNSETEPAPQVGLGHSGL